MSKPTVLYIAPRPPYPLMSGMAIRQYHLLRAYAEWGRVRLVAFYQDEQQRNAAKHFEEYCDRIDLVSTHTMIGETFRHSSVARRLINRLNGYRPTVVAWSRSPEMEQLVDGHLGSTDLIHVARLHMAVHVEGALRAGPQRPRMVLDLDDVESASAMRQLRYLQLSPLKRAHGYYEAARLWRYEARTVRLFDRVFVCSLRDRHRFRADNVVVVPNGAFVPAVLPPRPTDTATILFCGLLSYRPNIDAVFYLVKSVFPHIVRAVPEARLVIVGRAPTSDVKALHDGRSVVVAGDVPDVTDYYRRAAIAVVPLRFGGGTRIKILEAWAHGVPVVSTTIGCEGLEGVHGQHLMVADSPQEFAARCVALLRSPSVGDRLASEGWRLASGRYQWADIAARAISDVATTVRVSGETCNDGATGASRLR